MKILSLVLVAGSLLGCRTVERAVRHEQERKVREIVREEVPLIVHEEAGRLGLRALPWALGPTGLGAGLLFVKKRRQA